MYKTVHALVLREVKFKEADKMLTVLTQEEGKLAVRARGALRKSCRFGAAAQQLAYSEMTLFVNRGRCLLEEGSVIEDFSQLRDDFTAFALGAYFAELLESVSDEDSPNPEVLRLGLNALYALSRGMFPQRLIKAAFELRAMCLSGYEPDLYACSRCGKVDITNFRFDLAGGVLLCGDCAAQENSEGVPIPPDAVAAMRHVIASDLKRVFSFSLGEEATEAFCRVCERYTLVQLDRGFGALDYYKRLL